MCRRGREGKDQVGDGGKGGIESEKEGEERGIDSGGGGGGGCGRGEEDRRKGDCGEGGRDRREEGKRE